MYRTIHTQSELDKRSPYHLIEGIFCNVLDFSYKNLTYKEKAKNQHDNNNRRYNTEAHRKTYDKEKIC